VVISTFSVGKHYAAVILQVELVYLSDFI